MGAVKPVNRLVPRSRAREDSGCDQNGGRGDREIWERLTDT